MKKKFTIKTNHLEIISCVLLLLWTISPIIEYAFKNFYRKYYTLYFSNITYLIGSLGIIIYIIYFIKFKKKEKINIKKFIPEILLILLLVISVISSILSENQHLSIFGEPYRKEGLIVYFMYIGIMLMASIIKDNKYIKYICQSIIISCLIITIIPLFRNNFTYYKFTNIFHNTNHYGYYLMINVMLSLFMFMNSNKLIKKTTYIIIYIFFLYLLIRNNTFGSYLAVFATIIFLLIYSLITKYNRLKTVLIFILLMIVSFAVSNFDIKIGERIHLESTKGMLLNNLFVLKRDIKGIIDNDGAIMYSAGSYRLTLWKEAWKYTLKHPTFGGGMECLRNYYISDLKMFYTDFNDRPHNSIIQVAAFIGIPGAIIYFSFIMYIAISNLIIMKKDDTNIMIYASAMCYFLSSLLGNSMYYTSPYFMILLGLLIGFYRFKNKEKCDIIKIKKGEKNGI